MKIAIYSRKSKYTGKGDSIGNQIQMCKDYIETHYRNNDPEYIIYEDEGFSGGNINRPRFQKLLSDIKKEKFDILKNLQPGKFTPFTVMAAYEIWGKLFSQLGGLSTDEDDTNLPIIQEIKRLSLIYGTGYIWPVHDALAHMMYPEFPRKYFY